MTRSRPSTSPASRFHWLLPALVCLLAAPVAALDPARTLQQYVHRSWTIEDGMPQNSVTGLLQDRDGYLWITTYGGLARFDGVRFQTFAQAEHPSLPSDRLLTLAQGPDGSLWIGTESSGLARFLDGAFETVEPPGGPPLRGVTALHSGASGDLWIGSERGLLRRGPDGWERYDMAQAQSPHVTAVLETPDGQVLVGTTRGLARLDGRRLVPFLPDLVQDVVVDVLRLDRAGTVWIGGGRGLLWSLRDGRGRATGIDFQGTGRIRDLLEDRHGHLWVALDPEGLRRVTPEGVEVYRERYGDPMGRALSLMEDREGNVWIGTAGNGLRQLSRGNALSFGGPDHALGSPVVPIVSDGAGGILAGLACGGVVHMDAAGATRTYGREHGIENLCIWSLLREEDGRLWIGTLGGGLYRLEGDRATPVPLPTPGGNQVLSLRSSPTRGLLVGTRRGVYRAAAPEAERFELLPGTEELRVSCLAEDPGGSLWIGTDDGPRILSPGASRAAALPAALGGELVGTQVRAIHFDDAGAVWFGTYGQGLFRLHGGRLAQLRTAQGLAENVASRIVEDAHGRFWTTGNRGVQRIERSQLEAVAEGRREEVSGTLFTAADGMRISECNGGGEPAGLLDDDGRLWVPTLDGVSVFDTRDMVRNTLPPPVRIESVTVAGRPLEELEPGLARGDARAGRAGRSGPVLPAGARNLEIRYTGLSFSDPRRVRFRYRLEGEDHEWSEAGSRRVAYYPFLPPGRHHFRVIASNEDGVWNEEGASFVFTVEPRFVQTWRFRLLALLAAGLLVAAAVQVRLRTARHRQRWFQHEVETRTAELRETRENLERANRRLALLATLDPLTGIANRRSLMERLDAEWRRAIRRQRPLGLLMIDIDQFKPYNDLHGHPAGDRCLKKVVSTLNLQLRRADELLARYGGEELVAVIPEIDSLAALRRLAEVLRGRVEALELPHSASTVSPWITVSIGGALVIPSLDADAEGLLAVADTALYAAKEAGRNRVVVVEMQADELPEGKRDRTK